MITFVIREHCWIMFNLVSTGTLRFSPAVLRSNWSALNCLNPADSGWHFQLFLVFNVSVAAISFCRLFGHFT